MHGLRRKRINRTFRNVLFIVIGLFLVTFASVGYAYLSQDLEVKGTITAELPRQLDFEFSQDCEIYSTNPYNVDCSMIITNVGNIDATAWEIYLRLPDDVDLKGYYGCEYIGNEGTLYHFDDPDGHNDYIAVGESITFHLQFSTAIDYHIDYTVIYGTSTEGNGMGGYTYGNYPGATGGSSGGNTPINPANPCEGAFVSDDVIASEVNGDLTASYTVKQTWPAQGGTAYQIDLTVVNNGSTNTSYVSMVDIGSDGIVLGCYNGSCVGDNSVITLIPPSYSATIQPGQSSTIGYQFIMFGNARPNLMYIGKTANGYIPACQPGYSGGTVTPDPSNPGTDPVNPGTDDPGEPDIVLSDEISADFSYSGHWGSGRSGYETYQMRLTITNTSNHNVSGFRVTFGNATNADATGCWNGTCTHSGDTLIFQNNSSIAAGKSTTIDYQITMPTNTELFIKKVEVS